MVRKKMSKPCLHRRSTSPRLRTASVRPGGAWQHPEGVAPLRPLLDKKNYLPYLLLRVFATAQEVLRHAGRFCRVEQPPVGARTTKKKPGRMRAGASCNSMAEGEGFEPPEGSHLQRFSRPPRSTALPPLRRVGTSVPALLVMHSGRKLNTHGCKDATVLSFRLCARQRMFFAEKKTAHCPVWKRAVKKLATP